MTTLTVLKGEQNLQSKRLDFSSHLVTFFFLSLVVVRGILYSCGVRVFSLWLWHTGSRVRGLCSLWHAGSLIEVRELSSCDSQA